jgi:hypothetical protein
MTVKVKPVINALADVPAALRDLYTKRADGKFALDFDGEPVGYVTADKLNEFRENNRSLNGKVTELETKLSAFAAVDPEEYKALKARPDLTPRVSELETQLATEKAARAATQQSAAQAVFKSKVGDVFLQVGGRPEARDYIESKAAAVFSLKDGQLVTTEFSGNRPGEPLTIDEWMIGQTSASAFAFKPSSGGGAGDKIERSTSQGTKVISASEIGEHIEAVAQGKVTVGY